MTTRPRTKTGSAMVQHQLLCILSKCIRSDQTLIRRAKLKGIPQPGRARSRQRKKSTRNGFNSKGLRSAKDRGGHRGSNYLRVVKQLNRVRRHDIIELGQTPPRPHNQIQRRPTVKTIKVLRSENIGNGDFGEIRLQNVESLVQDSTGMWIYRRILQSLASFLHSTSQACVSLLSSTQIRHLYWIEFEMSLGLSDLSHRT